MIIYVIHNRAVDEIALMIDKELMEELLSFQNSDVALIATWDTDKDSNVVIGDALGDNFETAGSA